MSGDRISLKELRAELQAHDADALSSATLGVPLLLALVEAVDAAQGVVAMGDYADSEAYGRLTDALDRFKDYAGEAD